MDRSIAGEYRQWASRISASSSDNRYVTASDTIRQNSTHIAPVPASPYGLCYRVFTCSESQDTFQMHWPVETHAESGSDSNTQKTECLVPRLYAHIVDGGGGGGGSLSCFSKSGQVEAVCGGAGGRGGASVYAIPIPCPLDDLDVNHRAIESLKINIRVGRGGTAGVSRRYCPYTEEDPLDESHHGASGTQSHVRMGGFSGVPCIYNTSSVGLGKSAIVTGGRCGTITVNTTRTIPNPTSVNSLIASFAIQDAVPSHSYRVDIDEKCVKIARPTRVNDSAGHDDKRIYSFNDARCKENHYESSQTSYDDYRLQCQNITLASGGAHGKKGYCASETESGILTSLERAQLEDDCSTNDLVTPFPYNASPSFGLPIEKCASIWKSVTSSRMGDEQLTTDENGFTAFGSVGSRSFGVASTQHANHLPNPPTQNNIMKMWGFDESSLTPCDSHSSCVDDAVLAFGGAGGAAMYQTFFGHGGHGACCVKSDYFVSDGTLTRASNGHDGLVVLYWFARGS